MNQRIRILPLLGPSLFRTIALHALSIMAPAFLVGQDSNVESEDSVFELSPFEVSGESSGYRASDTLAGSQVRTDLGDVAASVSVVTQEFLQDTGATDASQIFNYLANTEGRGNFALAPTDQRGIPSNTAAIGSQNAGTRVRGLTAPDFTRGFFQTRVPVDSFNVERMTLNRGPNSVLFGLGSPAGIFNYAARSALSRLLGTSVALRSIRIQSCCS